MYNILIVDNSTQLEIIKSFFTTPEFNIHSSDDGEKAIELLLRIETDLLIINKDLPHNNCFEICKDLRENESTQSLPIILIDNSNNENDLDYDRTIFNQIISDPVSKLSLIESIHKVLGIPHSNDPNLLLNLNSHDLKKIIIDTLEQLPNYSCTKESLATKVLKNLKIRIKGSKRRKFEKSVNHIVGILKRQQIVKQYKAKNIRLKINPDYLDNQDTQSYLFKKSKVKSIIGREIDFQKSDIKYEDEYSNIDDEVTINSILKKTMLPELSEQNHNIDESFEYTDGEDDQSLLNTLTKREELSNADNTFKNSYTVIKNIFSKLKERNKYRIKYDLPNLDIQFNISTDIYEIKISPLGLQNSILLRSLIIFYEPAVLNILELFSRDDFIGSLSVETISNQKFYVLRYTINILKYNIEEILFTIDQVINESKKIIEIIDQKL